MKRFLLVIVVSLFLPCLNVHGQMAVADAALTTLMRLTHGETIVYFAQQVENQVDQIKQFVTMIQNAEKQIEMARQNLESIKNIDSWDDFVNFYNRQLYYERMAIEKVKGMNVSIGKKNYSLYNLEGIANGLDDTYIKYWEKEFTEEQRREMWLALGLSPENYAFVQPYRQKGLEIAREMRAMSLIQEDKNQKDSVANKKKKDALAKDMAQTEDNKKMGQKEVLENILDVAIQTDEKLSDISAMQAKDMEMKGIDKALNSPIKPTPRPSNWDNAETAFQR
ncbi:MAG: hypothetical protein LBV17_03905 [Treponema sp.]|jgi:hypothetical protein|nr:hypothetical protein [Treponema sp.]